MASGAENVTSTFTLNLDVKGAGSAKDAAKDLKAMRKSIVGTSGNIKEMQAALRLLKGGGDQTLEAQKKLKAELAAQRSVLAATAQSYRAAGGSLLEATGKQNTWTGALEKSVPKLGSLAAKIRAIPPGTVLLAAGAIGAAAAIAALTAAAAAGVANLTAYAIGQADARRSELLRLQGLTQIRNFWTGWGPVAGNGAATAASLQAAVDDVTGSVALSREQVTGFAGDLYRMGLRGQNLRLTLQGMATTAAVNGETQARAFAGMAAGANLTGQSIKALSDDVKARLGGIAKAQLLSLGTQAAKVRENFGMLFKDLKIDKLLEAIGGITRMTSGTSYLGAAMRRVVTNGIQPIVNGLAIGIPIARDFFFGLATGAIKVVIRLLDVAIWVKKTAKEWGLWKSKGVDAFKAGELAGKVFFGALVIGFALLGTLITGAVVAVGTLAAPLILVGLAAKWLWGKIFEAYDLIKSQGWGALGLAIVKGIVGGIKSGASWLVDSLTGLANAGVKAFKKAIDMRSPPHVFSAIGLQIPKATAMGVKLGAPEFTKATSDMLSLRALPPVGNAAPTTNVANTSSARTVTVGDIHVHVASGTDAQGIGLAVRRQLEEILSGAVSEVGARNAA